MAQNEMIELIEKYNEWKSLEEEAKKERENLENQIKAEMNARGTDELSIGRFIVRFTEIISNRFNTTEFKKQYPEVYKSFTKPVASRRFTVSE